MPIYPYTCSDCSREFESLSTRMTESAKPDCPACGSRNVTRGLGVPARVGGPISSAGDSGTNCRGDGPPCGAAWCGRPLK